MAVDFAPDKLSDIYSKVIRAMPGSNLLNVDFIRDICNCFDGVGTFIIPEPREGEILNAVHFVLDDLHAIVIPKHP